MRCIQGVDPKQCAKCTIFNSSFIQRQQLENLSVNDLKFYFEDNQLPIPSVRSKELLIEELLINQAKVLSQRALESQEILQDPSVLGELYFLPSRRGNPSASSSLPYVSSEAGNPNKTVQESNPKESKPSFVPGLVTNITDLTSPDQIDLLPVKILKIILQRNCINYKGCVEKEELKDRVKRLWIAREKAKALEDKIAGDLDAENEFLCKICMDEPVDCVLLECGHMLSCVKCGRKLSECPVCRQFVSRVVHAFKV